MIEVNEQVDVEGAPRAVWDLLSNPREVVDCVPGASLGEQQEDGRYDATVTVKFGPARVTFKAKVALDFDAATMVGKVSSTGKDTQGGTRMSGSMTFKVLERVDPPGSIVPIEAAVEVTGKLAMLVESGAKLVVKRMTTEFSERLAARFAGAGGAQLAAADEKQGRAES